MLPLKEQLVNLEELFFPVQCVYVVLEDPAPSTYVSHCVLVY